MAWPIGRCSGNQVCSCLWILWTGHVLLLQNHICLFEGFLDAFARSLKTLFCFESVSNMLDWKGAVLYG